MIHYKPLRSSVANGFKHKKKIDYFDIYAPIASAEISHNNTY